MRFNYQTVTNNVLSKNEVDRIIQSIEKNENNLGFGIRSFLSNNTEIIDHLRQASGFLKLVKENFDKPKIKESIYFDKPKTSNWVVNWHQDMTINLDRKLELKKYYNWRILKDRVVVQPDIKILNSILTYRIHLDRTDEI